MYGPVTLVLRILSMWERGVADNGGIDVLPLNGMNTDDCLTSSGLVVHLSGMNSSGWEKARSSGWR